MLFPDLVFLRNWEQHPSPVTFNSALFSSNKKHFHRTAATVWKELYLIIRAVVFLRNVWWRLMLWTVLWSNAYACLFINISSCFSWYIWRDHLWVVVVYRGSLERKYETVLTLDTLSGCSSKYLANSAMKTEYLSYCLLNLLNYCLFNLQDVLQ